MFKLIRLEMEKINFNTYIKRGVVAALSITAFLFFMLYIDRNLITTGSKDFLLLTDSIIRMVFIIFSGILISKLIIEEYHNRTITLMFTYPINRKKVLLSKLLIVISFTFVFICLTKVFTISILSLLANYIGFLSEDITFQIIKDHFANTLFYDFAASGMSLVPLFFGMRHMSTRTTIVASVIIAVLLGVNNSGTSAGSFIIFPITLTIIGLVVTYLSISNINQKDIL